MSYHHSYFTAQRFARTVQSTTPSLSASTNTVALIVSVGNHGRVLTGEDVYGFNLSVKLDEEDSDADADREIEERG